MTRLQGTSPFTRVGALLADDALESGLRESSRVGFGSAITVVLLLIVLGPILFYIGRAYERPT